VNPGWLSPGTRRRPAVRTWVREAAWLVVGAAERAVRVVTDRLSLFYHVGVVILSAAIAATLPFTFAFLAQRLLASWAAIEDEKVFLVLTECSSSATRGRTGRIGASPGWRGRPGWFI